MRGALSKLATEYLQLTYSLIITCIFLLCLIFFRIFLPDVSFAQTPCQTSNLNQGLISATGGITGNTLFGNTETVCITGTADASYREFKVPEYQDIEDQFYTFNRSVAKKTGAVPASLAFTGVNSGNGIYLHSGDLTINSSSGTGAQIIFVRGNLDITGNITYADTDSTSGLVFIVQGNINIDSTVTKVNAVLISSGIICTSYIAGAGCSDGTAFTQPLVVNGSLISLNKAPVGGSAIKFVRNLEVNNVAAEVINKQPKYLYILRNGLFTRDLVIITEDQSFPLPSTAYTPALSVNGRCTPVPPSAIVIPFAQTTWTFNGTISGTGIYNYAWTGSDNLSGSGTPSSIEKVYTSSGTKTASLIITDLGNPQTPPSQPITCSNFTAIPINFIDIDPARDIGQAINNIIDLPGSPPDIGAATPVFNFSLSNSGNITIQQGNSGNNTVTATITSGASASTTLSASGLPAGATASFSPTSCNPTCTSTLTITTSGSTPGGNSTITVIGNSGTVSRTTSFTLTVEPPIAFTTQLFAKEKNRTNIVLEYVTNICPTKATYFYKRSGNPTWSSVVDNAPVCVAGRVTKTIGSLTNDDNYDFYVVVENGTFSTATSITITAKTTGGD